MPAPRNTIPLSGCAPENMSGCHQGSIPKSQMPEAGEKTAYRDVRLLNSSHVSDTQPCQHRGISGERGVQSQVVRYVKTVLRRPTRGVCWADAHQGLTTSVYADGVFQRRHLFFLVVDTSMSCHPSNREQVKCSKGRAPLLLRVLRPEDAKLSPWPALS